MVAGNRLVANGSNRVGMALVMTKLSHRFVNKKAVNARQGINGTISPQILASEAGLGNLKSAWEGGEEGGGAASVTIIECLGAGVEPAFGWFADVEVTNEEPHSIKVRGPSTSSSTNSPSKFLKGLQAGSEGQ